MQRGEHPLSNTCFATCNLTPFCVASCTQVSHALELYKEAGLPTRSFVGVPVFQAEGLTVTTQEMVRASLSRL